MTLRDDNAQRARGFLLDAARREFLEHGYEGASVRRIAADAGVSTGTVFNYFHNKLDLLHQVFRSDLEVVLGEVLAVDDTSSISDQLLAMVKIPLGHFAAQPQLSRVLLKESLFATGESGAAFREQATRFAADVQRRFERAVAKGEAHVAPPIATLSFMSAYYFGLITCLASEPPNVEQALKLIVLQFDPMLGRTT